MAHLLAVCYMLHLECARLHIGTLLQACSSHVIATDTLGVCTGGYLSLCCMLQ